VIQLATNDRWGAGKPHPFSTGRAALKRQLISGAPPRPRPFIWDGATASQTGLPGLTEIAYPSRIRELLP